MSSPHETHGDALPSAQPLEGLTAVEFGSVAAAYAAKLLADFGADVVTLESARGDPLRDEPPHVRATDEGGPGAMRRYLRTNRRSVQLQSGEAMNDLLARSKVFVTDVPDAERSGVGLDTATLRARFDHLIVATISPFGSVGPAATARGGELVTYGAGGLAQASPGLPDGVEDPYLEGPLHPGGYPASITSGLCAAVAVLSAMPYDLPMSDAPGDHLDVSQQASVASIVSRYLAVSSYGGGPADRSNPGPLNVPNLYVPCLDGYVVIAAVLDAQWERLVRVLGEPEWARDPEWATAAGRKKRQHELEAHIRTWALERAGEEIVALAAEHAVPCFRFYRLDQMQASEHVVERGSLVEVPGTDGAVMPGAPFRLTRSPWRLRTGAPCEVTPIEQVLEQWERVDGARAESPRRLPLEGIRVLDFGQVLAIPFGTQWMSWLGADVVLVESKQHLHTRASPPFDRGEASPNESAMFNSFNSSKRSLTVDIKSEEGREILRQLVPHCDVLVENFRAGVLDRIGLSYEETRRLRPDIIHLALGAFGRSGPMKDAAGLHSAANLFSGLADVTRYPGGKPRIMGAVLPDPLSGINSLLAILMALRHRERTGEGQFIDQAMHETLLTLCAGAVMADEPTRASMRERGSQGDACVFGGFFPCRDRDHWVTVQADDERDWERLCVLVNMTLPLEGGTPPPHARLIMEGAVTAWTGQRSVADAVTELRAHGLAAASASTTTQILADDQLRAFGYVRQIDHPIVGPKWVPTLPWRSRHSDRLRYKPAPLLGDHVEEILTSLLGISHEHIARLKERGVLD